MEEGRSRGNCKTSTYRLSKPTGCCGPWFRSSISESFLFNYKFLSSPALVLHGQPISPCPIRAKKHKWTELVHTDGLVSGSMEGACIVRSLNELRPRTGMTLRRPADKLWLLSNRRLEEVSQVCQALYETNSNNNYHLTLRNSFVLCNSLVCYYLVCFCNIESPQVQDPKQRLNGLKTTHGLQSSWACGM